MKHIDDQIIEIKKVGGFFNALRIEKKLKEDIENEFLHEEEAKKAAEKKVESNKNKRNLHKDDLKIEAREKSIAEFKLKLEKKKLIME